MDFQACLLKIQQGEFLDENTMKKLTELISNYLLEESNVQPIDTPVTICGDLHGQLFDLDKLFSISGTLPTTRYVFLGDYVDRGAHSIETISYLFLLKAQYPSHITLLRGNHESRGISQGYGFYDEVMDKYGNANVWHYCMKTFDLLPISALIDGQVMCVHGGISPNVTTLDELRTIHRHQEVPTEGAFCDFLWSDPEDEIDTWAPSPRGAGYVFGELALKQFMLQNNVELVARSHQLIEEGYQFHFESKALVTVWSAPNYMYRCGNVASVMSLDENLNKDFKIFKQDDRSAHHQRKSVPHYFV